MRRMTSRDVLEPFGRGSPSVDVRTEPEFAAGQ